MIYLPITWIDLLCLIVIYYSCYFIIFKTVNNKLETLFPYDFGWKGFLVLILKTVNVFLFLTIVIKVGEAFLNRGLYV